MLDDKPEANGLKRREFLKWLGAVGGTGAVFSALDAFGMSMASQHDAPPDLSGRKDGTRVLVLGAGLAGMTAAYELSKLGYDTPILEARTFAGGRVQSARRGFTTTDVTGRTQRCLFDEGEYINHGPWRIPFHHRSTLHYTKRFEVPLEVMVNENDQAWILRDGIDGPFDGQRMRIREIKADMRGYTSELLAMAVDQDRLDTELSTGDKERLVSYLVHEGYLDSEDLVYRGASGRGYTSNPGAGLNPGEVSEPHEFLDVLRSGLGSAFRSIGSWTQQPTMLQPIGGMDQLAKAFERQVGHMIRYGMQVHRIRQHEEGVTVEVENVRSGETQSIEADYLVNTIPLSVLNQIDHGLSDDHRRALGSVSYASTGKIGLQFSRRFWEEDDHIYGGHSLTNLGTNLSYPSYGFHQRKGVLLGLYNFGGNAVQVSGLSLDDRIEYALDIGERVHPGNYREHYETGFSHFWHLDPHSLGGWASWTGDARREAYPVLNEPDGRIFLAGEHLSYLTGWMAGAIESSWLQIEKLHRRASQDEAAAALKGFARG